MTRMSPHRAIAKHAAAALAVLVLGACASVQTPAPQAPSSATAQDPDAPQPGDQVGGATATLPVVRWVGQALFQMIANTRLNVDVKVQTEGGK